MGLLNAGLEKVAGLEKGSGYAAGRKTSEKMEC